MKKTILYESYTDKIKGAWLGKIIGLNIGDAYKGKKVFEEVSPEKLCLEYEDINEEYIEKGVIDFLESAGTDFSPSDIVNLLSYEFKHRDPKDYFTSNFINNFEKGIDPPLSGEFNNNFFKESYNYSVIGDFFGRICPGNPKMVAEIAKKYCVCEHSGNYLWAEMFWAAANAESFVSDNLEEIINAGLSVIPEDCDISQIIYDVFMVYEHCDTLKEMWITLIRTWGNRDYYDCRINFAFSLLALIYGETDVMKTLACVTSLGWCANINCGIVCSLLGTILGCEKFKEGNFENIEEMRNYSPSGERLISLDSLTNDTVVLGIENMIDKNNLIDIVDIPEDIYTQACENYYNREEKKPLEISVSYEVADNVPALIEGVASCEMVIKNNSNRLISGVARLETEDDNIINVIFPENMTESIEFEVEANSVEKLLVSATMNVDENVVWQKNLVMAKLETEEETYEKVFGFGGSNHWTVYGPYWDLNEKSMYNQSADIDKEYLNENLLVKEEISEEYPFKVECAEFLMTNEDISERMGKTCYYFTREIVFENNTEAFLNLGITGPVKIWLDSEMIFESNLTEPWNPNMYLVPVEFERDVPRRFVIKAIQVTDEFKFSFNFLEYEEEKYFKAEDYYILNNYGDLV